MRHQGLQEFLSSVILQTKRWACCSEKLSWLPKSPHADFVGYSSYDKPQSERGCFTSFECLGLHYISLPTTNKKMGTRSWLNVEENQWDSSVCARQGLIQCKLIHRICHTNRRLINNLWLAADTDATSPLQISCTCLGHVHNWLIAFMWSAMVCPTPIPPSPVVKHNSSSSWLCVLYWPGLSFSSTGPPPPILQPKY